MTYFNLLHSYLSKQYSDSQIDLFNRYLLLMKKWNRIFNLTSITEDRDMVIKHVLDSLSVNDYLYGDRVIDVGTGGGLPGIPLSIANPNKQFVLLDSNSKKTRFLNQVTLELGLKNVRVVCARVEDYRSTSGFNTVISRAFSSMATMLKLTKHLCSSGGVFFAMKGAYPADEINEIDDNFLIKDMIRLQIPDLNAERHLVVLQHSSFFVP